MKMRTGTNTGKCDSRFNAIKVGDHLLPLLPDIHKPGYVDNYGTLVTEDFKVSPKEWNGEDYIVDEEKTEVASTKDWKKEADYWKQQYDEITISEFSAKSMVDELLNRGYDVKCTRTIVEEL